MAYPDGPSDDEDIPSIDFREYLGQILKYKWIVVLGVAAGIAAGVFYGRSQPVYYHASASVLLSAEAPRILGRDVDKAVEYGTNNWSADRSTFYNSELSIMRSEAVATLSVSEANLADIPEVAGDGTPDQRQRAALAAVQSSTVISLADLERTVWVTSTHRNPLAAAAIANAVVSGYQAFNRDRYRDGNKDATDWLAKELDTVEAELASADAKISAFKKDNDLLSFSMEDRRSLLGGQLSHYAEQASMAKTSRIGLELTHDKIVEAGQVPITESSIFELADSPTGRLLREKYVAATIDLESLSASLGPLHPTRLEQMERVGKLESSLEDEARVITATAREEYKKALALEGRLNAEVAALKQQAFGYGPQEIAHGALLRQRQEAAERAAHLRERYNQNNMAGRLHATNVKPLDSAYAPAYSGAKPWRNYVGGGGFLGLLLSVGLILLMYQLDSRLHRVGQVEDIAGACFLGSLPVLAEAGPGKTSAMSSFQEAIRIVRTNLHFLSPDVTQRTIMVTSPQPKDGKSTTAYWMAVSLAQMGKKVLLIDADMRNPSLHTILGIKRTDGLSDLIVGDITSEQAVRSTDFKNVHMIPAGQPIRDPAESLASKRFSSLLATFRDEYDIVIIDTPPVLPVADATLLCPKVDVALMIGRCGNTEKRALTHALAQLRRAKPKTLGVIANGAGMRGDRYYYKGYEGFSYGEALEPGLQSGASEASSS